MYFSLSWRNIWRNKKRTIIVAASVFFAVILSAVMRSAQLPTYSYMIHSSAKLFTGYLQVQGKDYWENRSLDRSIKLEKGQMQQIKNIPNVTNIVARLEAFALVSYDSDTKVSAVVGIDPDLENKMTGLKSKLTEGDYLNQSSNGILIGEGLAEILNTNIGDSLVILGQGFHGQTAAANLPIIGKVKLPFESMDNAMVFLALPKAQEVFSCENRITSLPVLIDEIHHLDAAHASVREIVGENYDIMLWNEMMPDLEQNIEVDNASGIIMMGILYAIISTTGISGLTLEWTSASAAAPSISADTVGAGAGVMGEPIVDEPYRHRVGDGVDVIARWHCRIGGSGSGPRAPSEASGEAAWTRQYGDGRVGYLALGHRSRTWANPEVVRLLEYLTSWCLTGVRS